MHWRSPTTSCKIWSGKVTEVSPRIMWQSTMLTPSPDLVYALNSIERSHVQIQMATRQIEAHRQVVVEGFQIIFKYLDRIGAAQGPKRVLEIFGTPESRDAFYSIRSKVEDMDTLISPRVLFKWSLHLGKILQEAPVPPTVT